MARLIRLLGGDFALAEEVAQEALAAALSQWPNEGVPPLGDELAGIPECLSCGACCFGPGPRYVRVTGDDHARLGEQAEPLTQFIENRCYMRMENGHCAALAIEADGRFVCRVYASRPEVCRQLARGSPGCQAELVQKRGASRRALLPLLDRER